jgi:predicted Zn-dependent protease
LIALALRKSPKAKLAHAAVAVVGLFGVYSLYRTGEHGGELVYAYAGGPGIRSGDPQDVGRLLLAGLYHQAQLDRKAGKAAEAAQLIDEAARRFGSSPEVQLLQIESRLVDRKDAAGALQALTALQVPAGSAPLQTRAAMLKADALLADGRRDDAIATLQQLSQQFPASTRIKQRLEQLTRPGGQ